MFFGGLAFHIRGWGGEDHSACSFFLSFLRYVSSMSVDNSKKKIHFLSFKVKAVKEREWFGKKKQGGVEHKRKCR